MNATTTLSATVGVRAACSALGLARATFYRHRQPAAPVAPRPRPRPPLALSAEEQQGVLDVFHSPRFVDASPRQVWATLLDEDQQHLCSVRTMYRLLENQGELRERRNQARHPAYKKPELRATGPNQVWTWDVTRLKGPVKWSYFYLYVVLDLYSRKVTGWMVARRECAELAKTLIEQTADKQNIRLGQLTLHADRGAIQTAKTFALLLADLGIKRSHSRPRTSNDNPYSEAHFKTLKYHPTFPGRFGSLEDARAFCARFFHHYNTKHRHCGLALLCPADVHRGQAENILERRGTVLLKAFQANPKRYKGRVPKPGALPEDGVWINRPESQDENNPAAALEAQTWNN